MGTSSLAPRGPLPWPTQPSAIAPTQPLPPDPSKFVYKEPTIYTATFDNAPPINLPHFYKDFSESVVDPAEEHLWTVFTYYPNHFNCSIVHIIEYLRSDAGVLHPYDPITNTLAEAEALLFTSYPRDHIEDEEFPMMEMLDKWTMETSKRVYEECPTHLELPVLVMRGRMLAASAWRYSMAGYYDQAYHVADLISADIRWAMRPPRTSL